MLLTVVVLTISSIISWHNSISRLLSTTLELPFSTPLTHVRLTMVAYITILINTSSSRCTWTMMVSLMNLSMRYLLHKVVEMMHVPTLSVVRLLVVARTTILARTMVKVVSILRSIMECLIRTTCVVTFLVR